LGIAATSPTNELTENSMNLIKYSRVKCSENACGFLDGSANGKLYLTGLNTDYGDIVAKAPATPTTLDTTSAYGIEVAALTAGKTEAILDFGFGDEVFIAHAEQTTTATGATVDSLFMGGTNMPTGFTTLEKEPITFLGTERI